MALPIAPREVQLTAVGKFQFPVYVTAPREDRRRLFVVEKAGRVRVMLDGRALAAPFLDIAADVAEGNEPGLLSMAFSPKYASNGLVYVYYAGADRKTHLEEFRRSATSCTNTPAKEATARSLRVSSSTTHYWQSSTDGSCTPTIA